VREGDAGWPGLLASPGARGAVGLVCAGWSGLVVLGGEPSLGLLSGCVGDRPSWPAASLGCAGSESVRVVVSGIALREGSAAEPSLLRSAPEGKDAGIFFTGAGRGGANPGVRGGGGAVGR
jgi:hypothetical protein